MSDNPKQVTYLTPPNASFEKSYKLVRDKEGRWLSDEQVKHLPTVESSSPKSAEWKKRAWMLRKFETYMSLAATNQVLDIGCGNGWMTNKIASHCELITGMDVGQEELEQAARCFGNKNTQFVCCEDWSLLPKNNYNLIYFAGSFQYFQPDEKFWSTLFSLLRTDGEIHILETHFYDDAQLQEAQLRSEAYFEKIGERVDYYHHLPWKVLPENYEVLYQPDFRNKLFKNRSPFPWIRIRK